MTELIVFKTSKANHCEKCFFHGNDLCLRVECKETGYFEMIQISESKQKEIHNILRKRLPKIKPKRNTGSR